MKKPLDAEAVEAFDALYSIDSNMEGCLGKKCPESCCGEKRTESINGRTHKYRVMMTDLEMAYQRELEEKDPQLKRLGVTIKEISLPIRHADRISFRTANLVNNCLGRNGCKLEEIGRKPRLCRQFPFNPDDLRQMHYMCPAASDMRKKGGNELKRRLKLIKEATKKYW